MNAPQEPTPQNPQQGYTQGYSEQSQHVPPQPQQQQLQQQFQQQVPPQTYQQLDKPSPFSRAWQDIKSMPNAFSTYGFRGLVNCVPILNFCFYGNVGNWQKQAADGMSSPIERKVVTSANFISGFFYFVISLVLGLVLGVVSAVPLLGTIAAIAGSLFVGTFAYVMYQRYLSFGSFSDAFALSDIVDKCKRNFAQLWVATFIPALIMGAISFVVCMVIMVPCALIAGFTAAPVSYYSSSVSVASLLAMGGVLLLGFVICLIVAVFLSTVGVMWSMRGCGYWVQENVPEWNSRNARIAKEQAAAQQAAQRQYYAQQQSQQQPYQENCYPQQQSSQPVQSAPYQQPPASYAPQQQPPTASQIIEEEDIQITSSSSKPVIHVQPYTIPIDLDGDGEPKNDK